PEETKKADAMLKAKNFPGLDGQTTNPTLIAKNLAKKNGGKKITPEEACAEYKRIVTQIDSVTHGPTSIQVIGNPETLTAEEMISQARERLTWIPTAVIKYPCTKEGLQAVEVMCQEGPVNVTLVFSQEQAAAVYTATKYHNYDCYVSPFVGRLDDIKQKGMDVVSNMLEMYRRLGDGHVKVLTASVRNMGHIHYALWLKSDVMTIPFKAFLEWEALGFAGPSKDFIYDVPGLTEIPYREINLENEWQSYDISHALTTAGLAKFWEDWSSVVE
ncbi:translaldolase, partial [sediment metagenome]